MNNPNNDSTFWPNWIGEDVECNVWIAGYEAAISEWTSSAMHLADLGDTLFAALQVEEGLGIEKIVLVGHSLGGLIIKSGMTQAKALGNLERMRLLERIAGVVFIGTPHQGASLATLANKLGPLIRPNPQVTNMVSDDAWLKLLNGQFKNLYKNQSFGVRVFFESKGYFFGFRICKIELGKRLLIVDRNSSDPNLDGVIPTAIDHDHVSIAKPASRNDLIHKMLVQFLKSITNKQTDNTQIEHDGSVQIGIEVDYRTKLLKASASLLSWPNTLCDGTWLHRPELDLLEEEFATSSSTHFLLGDPGCGKSSLLVRLAQNKHAENWCVLAIKADRLPPDILNAESLAKHLGLDCGISKVLRKISEHRPVLVLIDQVDALADLVVQHSARLRVLLDLVQEISDVQGVHTVISCRTFEQKHDPALRNLEANIIRLELPEWNIILPILQEKGLQAEAWNNDLQQVLRSPHALDIFLSLLGNATEPDVLKSFLGLLEKQWETIVLSDASGKRKSTIRLIAKLMADREVLGLPLALVEDHHLEIHTLAAAGLLRLDRGPGRVEFRHQTLYEFVRARSFLEESGSLTETVLSRQSSLRIRPQLWHALGYFRSASPEDYGTEIDKLWSSDLRPHLRILR